MSEVRILPAGSDVIEAVAAVLHSEPESLSRSLVIFPGKRPAHFLRKRLSRLRQTAFMPPAILSYDEMIDLLAAKAGLEGRDVDPLDAAALLYEIHRSASDPLGGEHFRSFDEFLPLGFRIFDELEELALADVGEQEVERVIGGISFGRRHSLALYFKELYQSINARHLVTRSVKLKHVAETFHSIDFSDYSSIVVAGFYSLRPVDRRVFKGFLSIGHLTMIFQEGPGLSGQMATIAADSGTLASQKNLTQAAGGSSGQISLFEEPGPSGESRSSRPLMKLYKSSDLHGQVFALANLLRSILEQEKTIDERTVIVLASSDALFPVLHHALSLLPVDRYNVSLGYPLSRTSLYAMVSNALELSVTSRDGSLDATAYLRLVLHPYIKNIRYGTRSDVTRVLFHSIEEYLAGRPSTTLRLEDLEANQQLFQRVVNAFSEEHSAVSRTGLSAHLKSLHDQIIRPFLRLETFGELAGKISDLVRVVDDRSTAPFHPLFRMSAEQLIETADGVRMSLAAGQRLSSASASVSLFRNMMARISLPFPGTPLGGLQVLGLLETRNLSFDRVIVVDASDENIPGGASEDALLPQGVREALDLETSHDRERLIEYYVEVLTGGAKEVHWFFSENKDRERSRLIQKLEWRTRSQEGGGTWAERQMRYAIHLVNPPPAPVEKSAAVAAELKGIELSATSLDDYLKCPLKFYYRYVLGLKEKEEVADEIEPYDVGNIVHTILKRFFEPAVGRSLVEEDMNPGRMDSLTEDEFKRVFGPELKGSPLLLWQQTAGRMREFLREYQLPMIEANHVELLAVEQEVSAVKGEHHFRGRIDRIERRGKKTFILDYKTRQDDAPYRVRWKKFLPHDPGTWRDAIGSLQLPMYRLLYSGTPEGAAASIEPAYLFLGRNRLSDEIETGLDGDRGGSDEAYGNLENVIIGLADEIKDPQKPFTPTTDQKKQCPRCPYQVICGTQWAREGRW